MSMRVLLAGERGRDVALAERLMLNEKCELHIASAKPNPQLIQMAADSGGTYYYLPSMTDVKSIADAADAAKADMFITHSDETLRANAVGVLAMRRPGILMGSPDSESSKPEWDKNLLREIIAEIDEESNTSYNPEYKSVANQEELKTALNHFIELGIAVAVKPRNLAGGKGVRVMGKDIVSYEDAYNYALKVLRDPGQEGLLIEEKIVGHEFTVQGITDGNVLKVPPATYDYPWREDGDTGAGTGGMGSFTQADGLLPFLSQDDYNEANKLMENILAKFKQRGLDFKGVLYGSFFKTANGIKITEINARGGEPELINIMDLLEDSVDMLDVYQQIARGELDLNSIQYKKLASAVINLVSPYYAREGEKSEVEFEVYPEVIARYGCKIRFCGARQIGTNRYSIGPNRAVAISDLMSEPGDAGSNIRQAMKMGVLGPLEHRKQVAQQTYIKNLKKIPV